MCDLDDSANHENHISWKNIRNLVIATVGRLTLDDQIMVAKIFGNLKHRD